MSEPANDWLAAREIADSRSRSKELATRFAKVVGPDDLVVDLACGTGANFRYLDCYLSSNQKWLAIDIDSGLIEQVRACLPQNRVACKKLNFATDLPSVPSGPGVAITASAFLDIASMDWLAKLAHHCRDKPLLIAMSAASQPIWHPVDELDESIRSRLESHQRSDHGFGPSLGVDTAKFLAEQLRDQGCCVTLCPSDWRLDSSDHALIAMIISGIARRVQSEPNAIDTKRWEQLRRDQLRRGELHILVRHIDLLSCPRRNPADDRFS